MTSRTPGVGGCLPPKDAPAVAFKSIWHRHAVVPPHPTAEDYLARLKNWQMLGNDVAGDCVAVTWANFTRFISALLGGHEVYPDQAAVWKIYQTQNPDFDPNGSADTNGPGSEADRGMDIQTLLEWLVKQGQIVAFAKVDWTNEAEVDAALAIFGGLWVGVLVSSENQEEFSEGKPWDAVGEPEGGHSILAGGYDPDGVRFISWAAETDFTDRFREERVNQLWAVIWPEHLGTTQFQAGINVAQLEADFESLTGSKVNWPKAA